MSLTMYSLVPDSVPEYDSLYIKASNCKKKFFPEILFSRGIVRIDSICVEGIFCEKQGCDHMSQACAYVI